MKECPNKFDTKHLWMSLVKSSSTEVSGPSELPQFVGKLFFWEAQLLCFCSKMVSIDVNRMSIGILSTSEH